MKAFTLHPTLISGSVSLIRSDGISAYSTFIRYKNYYHYYCCFWGMSITPLKCGQDESPTYEQPTYYFHGSRTHPEPLHTYAREKDINNPFKVCSRRGEKGKSYM